MKKITIRLFLVAAIGLALAACSGHDNQDQPTTTTTTTTETKETKTVKHTEHKETTPKSEVPTEKGAPTVDTADAVKPKDESTMGTNTEKHHVKPGGVH